MIWAHIAGRLNSGFDREIEALLPHIYYINWGGLVRVSGFRSGFRRPARFTYKTTHHETTHHLTAHHETSHHEMTQSQNDPDHQMAHLKTTHHERTLITKCPRSRNDPLFNVPSHNDPDYKYIVSKFVNQH
jgi:hypothetical protein